MNCPEEVVDEVLLRFVHIGPHLAIQIVIKDDHARYNRLHAADPAGDLAEGGHLTGDPARQGRGIEDPVTGGLEKGGNTREVAHGEGIVGHEAGEGEKEHHLAALEIEGRGAIDHDWIPLHREDSHFQERGARALDPGFKYRIYSLT